MDADAPNTGWVNRLQRGDPSAAEEVFARYAQRLTRLAEQHLSRRVGSREDGADVVQSVFRTFFRRSAEGQFRIDSSAQLWQLLVKITVLKARAKGRHHTAGPRDVGVEAPDPGAWLSEALSREPGPAEAAALVDQIEELLRGLPDLYGQVLEMRLQGHSVAEIAPRLGLSTRTIQRALNLLQQRLARSTAAG